MQHALNLRHGYKNNSNHTTNFTMKHNAGSLLYINWSGGRCTAGRGHCCSSATHHSKPVTPVNIKLSVVRRSASADDGTHMSSLVAAVAAPLLGVRGGTCVDVCQSQVVVGGTARASRYGPGRAQPGSWVRLIH